MYSHTTQIRVRYAETDQMGYMYYGNYPTLYEIGRTECFRELGISYKEIEDRGVFLPVRTLNVKYIKPAKYDDLVTIETKITELPSLKITFHYRLTNQDGELLNTGETSLVFIDKNTRKPTPAPQYILDILNKYF